VQVSAGHDNPLLLARTQMLAASFRILYDGWRKQDAELCASADQTIRSFSASGLPAYHEMMYSHVQSLQGDYQKALEKAEAAIPKTVGTDSLVVYLGGLSSKVFAFLHLGQLGEVLRLVLSGRAMAERNGNAPWLSIFRSLQAWLHTLAFDFEGELRLSKVVLGTNTEQLAEAPRLLAMLFAGYAELALGESEEALRHFVAIRDSPVQPRFFLHWYWRMNAQLGLSNVWLKSGKIVNARSEADGFLVSALSTADPHLQTLAWEMKARVAMAEKDWKGAEEHVHKALAVLEKLEVPVAAWRVHATAWDFYRHVKDKEAAERQRARAEAIVLALANSFADDEPLRKSLLAAAPIRRILGGARGTGAMAALSPPPQP
jgi:tetratricopeptide (TPR) repeat protein